MTAKMTTTLLLLALTTVFTACNRQEEQPPAAKPAAAVEALEAVATLQPTAGFDGKGQLVFTQEDGEVRISGSVGGLSPGPHGIHIHEFGDCSAPDATSAGGHFNPTGAPHGAPDAPADQRHVGDLGNIVAEADGNVHFEITDPLLRLAGEDAIIGRAVVIHGGADDFTSQPAGNAGPRVACGVIEKR